MVAMKHLRFLPVAGRVDQYSSAHSCRSCVSDGALWRRVHPEAAVKMGSSTSLRMGSGTSRSSLGVKLSFAGRGVGEGAGNAWAVRHRSRPVRAQLSYQDVAREYQIPNFTPFSTSTLNPLLAEASTGAHEWVVKYFGSALDPEQFKKLLNSNIYPLVAEVYPTASLPRLEWVLKYIMWFFIWDDETLYRKMESTAKYGLLQHYLEVQLLLVSAFPDDPTLQETLEKYLQHHGRPDLYQSTGTHVAEDFGTASLERQHKKTDIQVAKVSPTCLAFLDLWTEATSKMPEEWSRRFAHIFQRDLYAMWIEAQDIDHNIQPSVSSYILLRRQLGLMESSMVIVDYVNEVSLSNSIYYGSFMQRLLETTIDAVCWHNDIWSFPKELINGEMYNLVLLISKENNCSYNEAAELVNQMVVNKCIEIQQAAGELQDYCKHHELPASERDAINQYISCAYSWMSATHTFHSSSSRFHFADEVTLTLGKSHV